MRTSAIDVHAMLAVFSVDEVEKRIGDVPGVRSVTVNFAAGNATVRYDETLLEATDIKSAVRQRGFDPAAGAAGDGDGGNTAPGAQPAASPPAGSAPSLPDAPAAPARGGVPTADKAAVPAAPEPPAGGEPKDKAVPEKS